MVVTQFRADMGPQTFEKLLLEGAVSSRWWWARRPATGSRAASTSSTSATRAGNVVATTIRLVGTTLMWEQGGNTVRIEGAPDLETAKRIAESMERR